MIPFDSPCRDILKHSNTLWKTDGRSMQQSRIYMNMQHMTLHYFTLYIVQYNNQALVLRYQM